MESSHQGSVTSDTSEHQHHHPISGLLLVLPPLSPLVPPGEDAEDTDGDDDASQEGEAQPHSEEYPGLGLDHHQAIRSVASISDTQCLPPYI